MKRISTEQYEKYAEALRSQPGAFYDQSLTDKQLVDQHIKNLIINDFKVKRAAHQQRQVTEEDLDV